MIIFTIQEVLEPAPRGPHRGGEIFINRRELGKPRLVVQLEPPRRLLQRTGMKKVDYMAFLGSSCMRCRQWV